MCSTSVKYIALLAMVKIVPTHPELVAEYQDMILSSVDDQDISIRMRALDLLSAMVTSFSVLYMGSLTRYAGQPKQSPANCPAITIPSCPIRHRSAAVCYHFTIAAWFKRVCYRHEAHRFSLSFARVPPHVITADPGAMFKRYV